MAIDQSQEFLVQPVDASWLQCNIECQEACPVGTNCRGYLNLAAEGRFEEGYILSREPNPVAAMCSYVCSAPCERACRRGDIDRPLAIRAMKRFLVEWHEASGIPDVMPSITPREERVAVIGAGPAGIAVARELGDSGYQVTVFDSLPFGGGTMLIGVPAFRLPREAIEMDVRLVERLGVKFVFDTTIGIDIPFDDLQRDYDAIAITAGRDEPGLPRRPGRGPRRRPVRRRLHEEGEPRPGARGRHATSSSSAAATPPWTARARASATAPRTSPSPTAARGPSSSSTRRSWARPSARASTWSSSSAPSSSSARTASSPASGSSATSWASPTRPAAARPVPIEGSEFVVPADTVIPAVSQAADLTFLPVEANFEVNRGRIKVDPATYATNVRGVFACGDFVTGPTTLIEAAGHGKKAAYAIDRYLAGRTDVTVTPNVKITSSWRHEMPEFYDVLPRQHIPMVQLETRMPSTDPTVNFTTPVELGYDATAAVAESTRCLMCNYNIWFDPFRCVLCGACADVCPEGVIHMVDVNQLKTEGLLPEIEEAYGWSQGAAMILDEERCIRCALCVKRCPFDAITMERFELQEISSDGRLYKESYRDAQLAGTAGVAGGA